MLAQVNDNEEQAHQLGTLLQGRAVVLNLIPWNPVYSPEFEFKAPGRQRTDLFQSIVRQYGVHSTVRQEKGQDISGTSSSLATVEHTFMCMSKAPSNHAISRYDTWVSLQALVGSLW